ncbi:hypothetical protein KIPB_002114, partial [Kipferlia bialata]
LSTLTRVFVLFVRINHGFAVAKTNPIFTELLAPDAVNGPLLLIKDPKCDSDMYPKSFGVEFPPVTCIHNALEALSVGTLNVGVACTTLGIGDSTPKSKKVSMSNWGKWPLTHQQQLYAAFDPYFNVVCALTLATKIREVGLASSLSGVCVSEGQTQPSKAFSFTGVVSDLRARVSSMGIGLTDMVRQVVPKSMYSEFTTSKVCCPHCECRLSTAKAAVLHSILYHSVSVSRTQHRLSLSSPCLVTVPVPSHVLDAISRLPSKDQGIKIPSAEYLVESVMGMDRDAVDIAVCRAVRNIVVIHWRRPDLMTLLSGCLKSPFLSGSVTDWVLAVDWNLDQTPYEGMTNTELLSVMLDKKASDPTGIHVTHPYTGRHIRWRDLRSNLVKGYADELAAMGTSGERCVLSIAL